MFVSLNERPSTWSFERRPSFPSRHSRANPRAMGNCLASSSSVDDVERPSTSSSSSSSRTRDRAFRECQSDAFRIDWSTVRGSAVEVARVRSAWFALAPGVTQKEDDAREDDVRLARVGELECAIWVARMRRERGLSDGDGASARAKSAAEGDTRAREEDEWEKAFERARAFENEEIDRVSDWERVDRSRARARGASEREKGDDGDGRGEDVASSATAALRDAPSFEDDPDLDERLVVHYGRHKGGTVHSFKLSATFDAPPLRLIAVAREWDLLTKWNVFSIDATIMLVRGLTHLVTYTALWLPWPLSCRDSALVVRAVFLGQPPLASVTNARVHPDTCDGFQSCVPQSSAIVLARAVDPEDDVGIGFPKGAEKRKRVRLVGNSGARIRTLPPAPGTSRLRTRGDMVLHIDAQMPFVPGWLIQFILKTMAPWVHRMIDSMLKSTKYFERSDSMFQPRIDANPDLYDLVRFRFGHEGVVE